MPIRASSSRQIDSLIANLSAENAVTRETAVARLTLLGARAVERLIAATDSMPPIARTAAWRALEAIGDPRALEPALASLASSDLEPEVAAAAVGVARAHLRGVHGAAAVDRLATVLFDRTRHETLRLAALRALRDLEPAAVAPILATLADDPNGAIRLEAALRGGNAPSSSEDTAAVLARAREGELPDDPAILRHALAMSAQSLPLLELLELVKRIREREGSEPAKTREQWRIARGAAHVALAHRGSRLAVFDLRESLETAKGLLPVEFLEALRRVGDAICLEANAGAYAKARDGWWREHLAEAFKAITAREKLTRRHAALKKIEKRWPGCFATMAKG